MRSSTGPHRSRTSTSPCWSTRSRARGVIDTYPEVAVQAAFRLPTPSLTTSFSGLSPLLWIRYTWRSHRALLTGLAALARLAEVG